MPKYRVLICDDNQVVHQSLSAYLQKEDIDYESVFDGESALNAVKEQPFDLVILDIMLPVMFGTDVCREIRKFSDIPIIFLSAKGEEFDRVLGLELGADDYVTKPFSPREVVARIKTIMRRSSDKRSEILSLGRLRINEKAYQVEVAGNPVKMTPHEVELLAFLVSHKGNVISRDEILDHVWGENYFGDVRAVDTLIARIRGKIREHEAGVHFQSVYGVGYMIDEKKEA